MTCSIMLPCEQIRAKSQSNIKIVVSTEKQHFKTKHYYWMMQVTWFILTNQRGLIPERVFATVDSVISNEIASSLQEATRVSSLF